MPENKTNGYRKYLVYFKDIVYLITIVAGLMFYMKDSNRNKVIMETTVQNNTITLEKVDKFMDDQILLNGKFIQFMEMDVHE
jgi:hypothetical protein